MHAPVVCGSHGMTAEIASADARPKAEGIGSALSRKLTRMWRMVDGQLFLARAGNNHACSIAFGWRVIGHHRLRHGESRRELRA